MMTQEKEQLLNPQNDYGLTREEVIEAWKELPQYESLMETPEMVEAMVDLLIALHGETLKELELH